MLMNMKILPKMRNRWYVREWNGPGLLDTDGSVFRKGQEAWGDNGLSDEQQQRDDSLSENTTGQKYLRDRRRIHGVMKQTIIFQWQALLVAFHLSHSNFLQGWLYNPFTPFGPVVEKNSAKPFIDKSPIDVMQRGEAADLPWVTSVVTEEGLYPGAEFIANDKLIKELDENWEVIAPYLLDYNYTIPREEHAALARQIRKHYLGDKAIDRETVNNVIQMIGDRQFVVDGEKAARSMAAANDKPVRFYRFSYRGEHSLSDWFTGSKKNYGWYLPFQK